MNRCVVPGGCPVGPGCGGGTHTRLCQLIAEGRNDYRDLLLRRAGLAPARPVDVAPDRRPTTFAGRSELPAAASDLRGPVSFLVPSVPTTGSASDLSQPLRVAEPSQIAVLAAVGACPERGGVLSTSLQAEQSGCGCGSAELSECRVGLGRVPGRVSLRDCMACRAAQSVTIRGHLNGFTGYGQHTAAIGHELEKLGLPVAFVAAEINPAGFLPLDPFVAARVVES